MNRWGALMMLAVIVACAIAVAVLNTRMRERNRTCASQPNSVSAYCCPLIELAPSRRPY